MAREKSVYSKRSPQGDSLRTSALFAAVFVKRRIACVEILCVQSVLCYAECFAESYMMILKSPLYRYSAVRGVYSTDKRISDAAFVAEAQFVP